jgi:hypothetical protein
MNVDPLAAIWLAIAFFVLAYVGFILLVGMSAVVTALVEKRRVRNLAPVDLDGQSPSANDPGPDPYMDAVNELAGQLGFEFGGIFARAKKGAGKHRVAVWRARERDILVVVSIWQAAPMQLKLTLLVSLIGGRYLITTDEFGEDDISGFLDYEVLNQAQFPELLARHEDRLAGSNVQPVLFLAQDMSEDLIAMQKARACQMVKLGYAKFLDSDNNVWRHTAKGAVHFFFRSYLKQLIRGGWTGRRRWRGRPSS